MKRILILVFAVFWLLSRSLSAAETSEGALKQTTGLGIGTIIGALIGGPPGAIIGAAGGAWLGQRDASRDAELAALAKRLRRRTSELSAIKAQFDALHARGPTATRTAAPAAAAPGRPALDDGLSMAIFFRTASADIEPALRAHLERLGKLLQSLPELQVHLTGHADRRGSEADNLMLSAQRLGSVRTALQSSGVDAARIHTRALGEFQASGALGDTDAMAFDRKVVIRLSLDSEA